MIGRGSKSALYYFTSQVYTKSIAFYQSVSSMYNVISFFKFNIVFLFVFITLL